LAFLPGTSFGLRQTGSPAAPTANANGPVEDQIMNNSSDKTTGVRHVVVLFAATLAVVTYVQRVAISQAAPFMQQDLGLTKVQMGLVFSVFSWMYAGFEIPLGFAGDRWGARRVLTILVAVWSFFTTATGWVRSFWALIYVRGLFGVFQAGCFPNIARMFANWLPTSERVRAQGIMWLSARWGGAFAPLAVVWLLGYMSWRQAFGIFGLAGIAWAGLFFWWFRDNPEDHPAVDRAELEKMPTSDHLSLELWGKFFSSKAVWLLCGQYMCLNFGWQFYVTWLPTYLLEARGVELHKTALLAALPLFFGGLGSLACGFVSSYLDRLTRNVKVTRRLLAGSGFTGAAICFALSIHIRNPVWAMVALGVASFSNDLVMPTSWATCMDVGGKVCGTLAGTMNMMGGFVAAAAPTAVALILDWSNENWAIAFYVSAAIYFMGTFFWLALDPTEPIELELTMDRGGGADTGKKPG
jgi:sugar phosphate permease